MRLTLDHAPASTDPGSPGRPTLPPPRSPKPAVPGAQSLPAPVGRRGLVFILLVGMALLSFTRPTYACTTIFDPSPAPSWIAPSAAPVASGESPAPAVTPPAPGFVQTDMGNVHAPRRGRHLPVLPAGQRQALQRHESRSDPSRPVRPERPDGPAGLGPQPRARRDRAALLVQGAEGQTAPACTDAGQQQLEDLITRWPDSPICKIPKGTLTR